MLEQMKPFRSRSGWQRLSRHRWGQSSCRTSPPPPPCRTTSVWTNTPPSDCCPERAQWVILLLEEGLACSCLEIYMCEFWDPNLSVFFFCVSLRDICEDSTLVLSKWLIWSQSSCWVHLFSLNPPLVLHELYNQSVLICFSPVLPRHPL